MTEHASIDKIEQGSEEWHALRRGKVTSSRIADLMRKGRGGTESTSYQRYLADIIVERMTDLSAARSFKTAAMERGNIVEPRAALAYEFYRGVDTATVSFVDHPTIPNAGASPDRLVGNDGLAEFKCPETHTHLQTILSKTIDPNYITQMQWQLACTKRLWCDFVSFDDRLPPPLDIHIVRIARNPATIVALETAARDFLADVDKTIDQLTTIKGAKCQTTAAK